MRPLPATLPITCIPSRAQCPDPKQSRSRGPTATKPGAKASSNGQVCARRNRCVWGQTGAHTPGQSPSLTARTTKSASHWRIGMGLARLHPAQETLSRFCIRTWRGGNITEVQPRPSGRVGAAPGIALKRANTSPSPWTAPRARLTSTRSGNSWAK